LALGFIEHADLRREAREDIAALTAEAAQAASA
jgi:hypothetical protein